MKRIILCLLLALLLPCALADEGEPCQHTNTYVEKEVVHKCLGPVIERTYCRDCGALLNTREYPGQGHDFDWYLVEAGSCVKESIYRGVCVNCGHEETASRGVESTKHNYGDWYVVKEATPTSYGIKERKCVDCGAIDRDTVDYVCPGHDYQPVIDEPATPYYPGRYRMVCSICGDGDTHTITYNYGEYPTELQGGMVTRTPPPTKPGQTPSPSPIPEPTITPTVDPMGTIAPSATPRPSATPAATAVPVTAAPQTIAPQSLPTPVTLEQVQRIALRDVSGAGLHGIAAGSGAEEAVAAIGAALTEEAGAGGTLVTIVGMSDLLTSEEKALYDQLDVTQQLMLVCHLLGMDDALREDVLTPQTMLLMGEISSRIRGMSQAEEGAYLTALNERFPMDVVAVDGQNQFASMVSVAVQTVGSVRVEKYGFHLSPSGWTIAYIGAN